MVGAAAGDGAALVATGLGAHLDIGAPPRRVDVLLRLDRLDAVLDHQAADMTVTRAGGLHASRLDGALATAAQWLPLDPPRPEATTVGGLIAANLSGPLRASQGTVRDLLLGLRRVGADGALVAGGGRVVKNVAGYDLPKLHVGALGTLGVIVEATFKVRPRPEREEAVVLACAPRRRRPSSASTSGTPSPLWLEVAARALSPTAGRRGRARRRLAGDQAEVAPPRDGRGARAARGPRALAGRRRRALRARLAPSRRARRRPCSARDLPAEVGDVLTAIDAAPAARARRPLPRTRERRRAGVGRRARRGRRLVARCARRSRRAAARWSSSARRPPSSAGSTCGVSATRRSSSCGA